MNHHSCLQCQKKLIKTPDLFDDISLTKAIFKKIFEEKMLITIQPTTLLQIFCEFIITSQVIFKSSIDPDDTCQEYLQVLKYSPIHSQEFLLSIVIWICQSFENNRIKILFLQVVVCVVINVFFWNVQNMPTFNDFTKIYNKVVSFKPTMSMIGQTRIQILHKHSFNVEVSSTNRFYRTLKAIEREKYY